jgi:hypothetical protein
LLKVSRDIFEKDFLPEVQADKKSKNRINDIPCYIHLVAHNGHKADYPLVEKFLLNN